MLKSHWFASWLKLTVEWSCSYFKSPFKQRAHGGRRNISNICRSNSSSSHEENKRHTVHKKKKKQPTDRVTINTSRGETQRRAWSLDEHPAKIWREYKSYQMLFTVFRQFVDKFGSFTTQMNRESSRFGWNHLINVRIWTASWKETKTILGWFRGSGWH